MIEEKKTKAQRDEQRRRDEQKDRRSMAVYSAIAALVVIAAVILMFWNSGILQRSMTALNINGVKYTAADLQYCYNNIYSEYANQYAFNPNASVKGQIYDQETGKTWFDFLKEETVSTLTEQTALVSLANAEGHTLSEASQAQLNSTLTQLNSSWVSYGFASRDAFIKTNFGPHMTYDRLVELMTQGYLAGDYANAKLDAIAHSDADYDAYYQEHTNELDTIVYTQFTFQAQPPVTDEAGNTIEMTDEEKAAALEELKPQQKALAEEVKAKLEAGAEPEALAEEYGDQIYSTALSRRTTASNASYSSYADWLLDPARRAGDITLAENDTGSACYYYVSVFEDRLRDEEATHNVRHLLVRAGSASASETPTQEEYDQAEEEAARLLQEWKSGEATESSFAALVSANSDDTGSAQNGGLISNITPTSSYVEAFLNWSTDPARREGDTDLVKTEYGWHIMYYVSTGDPVWRQTAGAALKDQDYEQLTSDAVQGWNITQGMGMNFLAP